MKSIISISVSRLYWFNKHHAVSVHRRSIPHILKLHLFIHQISTGQNLISNNRKWIPELPMGMSTWQGAPCRWDDQMTSGHFSARTNKSLMTVKRWRIYRENNSWYIMTKVGRLCDKRQQSPISVILERGK